MPKEQQSFLEGLGIAVSDVGTPFWKPDSKKQTVTLTGVKPSGITKELKDGGKIKILAVADVSIRGVPHTWEISSKRALAALNVAVKKLPVDLDIQAHGAGTDVRFTIVVHVDETPRAKSKLGPPCDAPGCVQEMGHHGQHIVAKKKEADA